MADLKIVADADEEEQRVLEEIIGLFEEPLEYMKENLDPVNSKRLRERYGNKSAIDIIVEYFQQLSPAEMKEIESKDLEGEVIMQLHAPLIKLSGLQIQLDPNCPASVYRLYGSFQTELDYPKAEAIELMELGTQKYSDDDVLHDYLGIAYFQAAMEAKDQKNITRQIRYLENAVIAANKALELNPDIGKDVEARVELYEKRKSQAIRTLRLKKIIDEIKK